MSGQKRKGTKRSIKLNVDAENILLTDVFERFVDERSHEVVGVTMKGYRNSFNKLMDYIVWKNNQEGIDDEITINTIDTGVVKSFIKHRQHNGVKNQTINNDIRNLRVFLYWCMRNEHIEKFVINTVKEDETKEKVKAFTDEEKMIVMEKPRRKRQSDFIEWRTWTIVCYVIDSGSRAESICNIKMKDIDFIKREIVLSHTKNKKTHITPMSTAFMTALKEYIHLCRGDAEPDDYLFPNTGNERLSTGALRQSLARYCADRGVNKKSIHGLRHTFAKGYLMNNGDTFRLQKLLGHSTQAMTSKYARLFDEDIKTGYDDLSPYATAKKSKSRKKDVQMSNNDR